jgi:hypothetical protein
MCLTEEYVLSHVDFGKAGTNDDLLCHMSDNNGDPRKHADCVSTGCYMQEERGTKP